MQVIRLVPKGQWELPVTCKHCGTQMALEPDDMYFEEYIQFHPLALFHAGRVQKLLRFPDCVSCGRRISPSEQDRGTLDRRMWTMGIDGVEVWKPRVVAGGDVAAARDRGEINEDGDYRRKQ